MAKSESPIKIQIESTTGTVVDITAYVSSLQYDTEVYKRRRGLLGWLAWTFKIKRLMWVKG